MDQISEDYQNYKKSGGGIFRRNLSFIEVRGPDAPDFLQRMTSQNIKEIAAGEGLPNALLQPNAMIISLFQNYNLGSHFLLVTEENLAQLTADTLEKFHFTEDLEIKNLMGKFSTLSVQGARTEEVLKKVFPHLPGPELHKIVQADFHGLSVIVARENDFLEGNGFHLIFPSELGDPMERRISSEGLSPLSQELWSLLRFESGHFQLGNDIGEKNLVLEAPLNDYVSRNKGCFPGQEVIERVFTYGNVAKKLVALNSVVDETTATSCLVPGAKILAGEKEVGMVTSFASLPWSGKLVVLAMVRKPFYESDQVLNIAGHDFKVAPLPQSFTISKDA